MLIFTVAAERSNVHLDRQALLKLVSLSSQSATWQRSEDNSQAVFTNLPYGTYDVEVSAVCYLTAHKQMQVMVSLHPLETVIGLPRDPEAVNLDVGDSRFAAEGAQGNETRCFRSEVWEFQGGAKRIRRGLQVILIQPGLELPSRVFVFSEKRFWAGRELSGKGRES